MDFEFSRRTGRPSPITGDATFRVDRLSRIHARGGRAIDLSHLIDDSYEYHSPRELRWHLAERLGLAPAAVALREAA